ncbi:MAG: hypothetical protein IMF18_09440 [Proteobacteria bacterium]|nr:hypothetical protein [Pseudomonadota bacterium]
MMPFFAGHRLLASDGKDLSPHRKIVQEEYQGAEIEDCPRTSKARYRTDCCAALKAEYGQAKEARDAKIR